MKRLVFYAVMSVFFVRIECMKEDPAADTSPDERYTGQTLVTLHGHTFEGGESEKSLVKGVWLSPDEIGIQVERKNVADMLYVYRWKEKRMDVITPKQKDIFWKKTWITHRQYGNGKRIELFSNSEPGACLGACAYLVKVDKKRNRTDEWKHLINSDVRVRGSFVWSRDGTHLAVELANRRDGDRRLGLYVFSVKSAIDFKQVAWFDPKSISGYHKSRIHQLKFNTANTFLAGSCQDTVSLFDVKNQRIISSFKFPNLNKIHWHPTDDVLLLGQSAWADVIYCGNPYKDLDYCLYTSLVKEGAIKPKPFQNRYSAPDVSLRLVRIAQLMKENKEKETS